MTEQRHTNIDNLNLQVATRTEGLSTESREIIPAKSLKLISGILVEEFGEDQIISFGLFGSRAQERASNNSDFDFIVIVNGLPTDIHQREDISPRIKKRLREHDVEELCAFNLYTPEEFSSANKNNSWLLETMKNGYVVFSDNDAFLSTILSRKAEEVSQKGDFVWEGVVPEDESHISSVIKRHVKCAVILEANHPQLSNHHMREAFRGATIQVLNKSRIVASRGSLKDLAYLAYSHLGDNSAVMQSIDRLDTMAEDLTYDVDQVEQFLQASYVLEENGLLLDSLFYAHAALKCKQVSALKRNNIDIPSSEINQLFLIKFQNSLPQDLVDQLYTKAFKAEQILGRSQYFSFDLDEAGKPIFEEEDSGFDYTELLASIREISTLINTNIKIDS